MVKPLVSANSQPHDLQFAHFGVLNAGAQSKSSVATAVGVNVLLAIFAIIISAAAVKVSADNRAKELTYVTPVKPPEPIKPKPLPPPPKPPPVLPKPVEPKIVLPAVTPPIVPKPISVPTPKPMPIVTPAPPKLVVAAAAPKPTTVSLGQSASVVNHDLHPSAVALGSPSNPIAPSNRPSTSAVNLGQRGLAGMPSSNTGGEVRIRLGSI